MAVELTDNIAPSGDSGGTPATFPTHLDTYGYGGYRSVANENERLGSTGVLTELRRQLGMAVYQQDTSKLYILTNNPSNPGFNPPVPTTQATDWTEFAGGSGPGGSIDVTGVKPDGSLADIQSATELALNTANFTVDPGTPNTKAEITSAFNTTIASATSVAININSLNNLTAADFEGLSMTEVFNKILFPTLPPSYLPGPNVAFSNSNGSTVFEIGQSVTSTLTLSLIKNNSGGLGNTPSPGITFGGVAILGSQLPDASVANLPDQFGFPNTNSPNVRSSYQSTHTAVMPASGSISYAGDISWLDGQQLKDSTGALSGTAVVAGSSVQANTINGIYPWFHFRSSSPITTASMQAAIAANNATKELSSSTGTIDVPFLIAAPGEYLAVAYPATSTTKTKFFVNVSNQGLISVIFNDPPVTAPVDSPDGFWTGINYKIIVSNSLQQSTDSPLELRNN